MGTALPVTLIFWYLSDRLKYTKQRLIQFSLLVPHNNTSLQEQTVSVKFLLLFFSTDFYHKVTELKSRGIKVLIALGGWNDSLGDKYSRLVNSASARGNFVRTVVEFIEKYNFDGLDLDWEYPKCWQVSVASVEFNFSVANSTTLHVAII